MTATATETEVLPEGYDQEKWEDLKDALNSLGTEDAIVTALTLAMLGLPVKGPEEFDTPQESLIDVARTYPGEVASAAMLAALQGLGLNI